MISASIRTKAEDWRKEVERSISSLKDWGDVPSISGPGKGNRGFDNRKGNRVI